MPQKISAQPSNKIRIEKLASQILAWRKDGYYLSHIYDWLVQTEQLSCSFGNFKRYYYPALKKLRDSQTVEDVRQPSVSPSVPDLEVRSQESPSSESHQSGRIGDDFDPKKVSSLSKIVFRNQRKS